MWEVRSKEYKWAYVNWHEYLSFRADEVHALKTIYSLFPRSTKGVIQVKEKYGCKPLTQTMKSNDDCSKALYRLNESDSTKVRLR